MQKVLVLALLFAGCGAPRASVNTGSDDGTPPVIAELTIPPLNEWTDRYAGGKNGDVRFFNLTKVMRRYDLNRLQAVEVQNTYRDLTRGSADISRLDAFNQAVERVKSGKLESGFDLEAASGAAFIVVFDLDGTIYDQYYGGAESCNSFAFRRKNGKMKYIQAVPGWVEIIKKINELGGKVVLFSANLDDRTITNLKNMTIDNVPLTESPLIAGVMTNSHLTQQEKTEPPGSVEKPRKGRPVVKPSKDLRHFDPTLQRVIIVDDNPLRLFQFRNVRVFKKFHADQWCTTEDADLKAAYNGAMPAVGREIEDAVKFMRVNEGISFVTAYLPYSALGRVTVDFLMDGKGWTRAEAIEYVRRHPKVVDKRF